jgi:methionyl-tRNA synthetase
MKPFFITTTIPYVNGDPHIGHALEYVQADTVARAKRVEGRDVHFLTGTDENSLKNVQAAEEVGEPVDEFVAEKAAEFYRLKDSLNISFDDFIRTTEHRHVVGAQKFWQACDPSDIYKKTYQGLYCVGCEMFYTEDELVDGKCPDHLKVPELVEEENYFFKLSRYADQIRELIANDVVRVYPENKKNETLAFIGRGLEDFSISRSRERAHGWGIPVPDDEEQIMYVWFDALTNYITALGYVELADEYQRYWKQGIDREVVHILGKGVARFHLIYWLGMLLSAAVELPTEEYIHGYLTINGQKMSKSLGNVVHPRDLAEKYGTDAVRYYLLGAISPSQDGDFSDDRLVEYYNAHLANGVGNLTSRVLTMVEKYAEGIVPARVQDLFSFKNTVADVYEAIGTYSFDDAVRLTQSIVGRIDEKISVDKPWERVKAGENIDELLYALTEGLRQLAVALLPIIPRTAESIFEKMSIRIEDVRDMTLDELSSWGVTEPGTRVEKGEMLFGRM